MSGKSRRMGALMLAMIAVVLCVSIMAVGTYALFSESVTVPSHLQSGSLDASLTRVSVISTELDKTTGKLVDKTNNTVLTDGQITNIFGIDAEDKIVPGCSYTANMRIDNNGDVAFGYYIKIDITEGATTPLAQQLEVVVTAEDGTQIAVGSGYTSNPIGIVLAGKSANFTVKVALPEAADNDVEDQSVSFDLTVYAEQSLAR